MTEMHGAPEPAPAALGGYSLLRELGRGAHGVVFEALDPHSRSVVALKTLSQVDPESIYRLKHEFRALADVEHPHLVRFGELATDAGWWFFTMERIDGCDFVSHVRPSAREAATSALDEARLRAALAQLVDGVSWLHDSGRLHRDLKPSNVLVSREGRVVVLDFGLLSTIAGPGGGRDEAIVGTPPFMPPEQFEGGAIGPAADWYAVGVILFMALTGAHPFSDDLLSVIAAKTNEDFPRPSERAPGVPPDLDALCIDLLRSNPALRPGAAEIRARVGLPRAPRREPRVEAAVFVGREAELAALERALADVRSGQGRAVIIEGEPGVGKTALVQRFVSGIAGDRPPEGRALVLAGRCYEQENVPFGGVDSLMDALAEYLLSQGADAADALLSDGIGYLAQMFPALLRVPAVAARTAPNRSLGSAALVRALAIGELSRLVAAIGRARPVVVVLDDLQWISDAGAAVLASTVLPGCGVACLFVATLRSAVSPPAAALEGAERLRVGALSADESRALWDALEAPGDGALRDEAIREAAGHPLFLSELARSVAATGARAGPEARLKDVLAQRVRSRDAVERAYLEATAVAGGPTPHEVLVRAARLDPGECDARLWSLRAAQLVRVTRSGGERRVEPYHAHVREAVVATLEGDGDARVVELHRRVGEALGDTTPAVLLARVFAVVHHLHLARPLLESPEELRRLAELDLLASREALAATAFDRASAYARAGLECLAGGGAPEDGLAQDLRTALFEAEYLAGRRASARAVFEDALARGGDPVGRGALWAAWIRRESHMAPAAALEAGREALRELGAPLPGRATKAHVLAEYMAVRALHRGRSPPELGALPPLRDARRRSVLHVLMAVAPSAYFVEPALYPWIMLRMTRLSLAHGLSEFAPFGLAGYATLLASVFGRDEEAAGFVRLALSLASRFDEPRLAARIHFMNAMFVVSWARPFRVAKGEYDAAYALALRHGETVYEGYAAAGQIYSVFAEGTSLDDLRERSMWALGALVRRQDRVQGAIVYSVARHAARLRGRALDHGSLGLLGSEADLLASVAGAPTPMAGFWQHLCDAEAAYLGGDLGAAEAHLSATRAHQALAPTARAESFFLRALVAAARAGNAGVTERARCVATIALAARTLAGWAGRCPANFEPYALIVRAELLRVAGFEGRAARAYDRAIESSRRWGAAKLEALACRLAAAHARTRGDTAGRASYERRAAAAYRAWGAVALASEIEAREG